jgi:putative copper export protein
VSRFLWWATVVTATVVVSGVAASRVYLGVHWFTDLIEGFLLGSLYLVALEVLFAHHHRHRSCPLIERDSSPVVDGRDSIAQVSRRAADPPAPDGRVLVQARKMFWLRVRASEDR